MPRIEQIAMTGSAGRRPILAWRTWVLRLAGLGIILGIASADGGLETGAGGDERPSARIAQEHESPVWTLAFGGSTRLAASTLSGEVEVTTLATGQAWRLRRESWSHFRSLAFSPGGRVLAIGGLWAGLQFWDLVEGIEQEPLREATEAVRSVTFAPDGTKLAVGTWKLGNQPAMVTVWEWPTRRRLAELGDFPGSVNVLAFSPDGVRLVVGDSSGKVRLWNLGTGRELARWQPHDPPIIGLAFSPDDRLIATSSHADRDIRLWDASSGGPRGTLRVPPGVAAVAFSPDGTLLAIARGDGIAALLDVASGRQVGAFRVPSGSLQAVAFSEDGRLLATGGSDGSVRLWKVDTMLKGELESSSQAGPRCL
jgi:WD40 repeat protein